jgi:hypothetical protein
VAKKVSGSLGYNENGLMVAFPYMSPDNVCELWANLRLAHAFTLNGKGVKGGGGGLKLNATPGGLKEVFDKHLDQVKKQASDVLAEATDTPATPLSGVAALVRTMHGLSRAGKQLTSDPQVQVALDETLAQLQARIHLVMEKQVEKLELSVSRAVGDNLDLQAWSELYRHYSNLQQNVPILQPMLGSDMGLGERIGVTGETLRQLLSYRTRQEVDELLDTVGKNPSPSLADIGNLCDRILAVRVISGLPIDSHETGPALARLEELLRVRAEAPLNREVEALRSGLTTLAAAPERAVEMTESVSLVSKVQRIVSLQEELSRTFGVAKTSIQAAQTFTYLVASIEKGISNPAAFSMKDMTPLHNLLSSLVGEGSKFGRDARSDRAELIGRVLDCCEGALPRTASLEFSSARKTLGKLAEMVATDYPDLKKRITDLQEKMPSQKDPSAASMILMGPPGIGKSKMIEKMMDIYSHDKISTQEIFELPEKDNPMIFLPSHLDKSASMGEKLFEESKGSFKNFYFFHSSNPGDKPQKEVDELLSKFHGKGTSPSPASGGAAAKYDAAVESFIRILKKYEKDAPPLFTFQSLGASEYFTKAIAEKPLASETPSTPDENPS